MLTNLLFRLSTIGRPSGQDDTRTRLEVCPPSLRPLLARPLNRWRDTFSSWFRGHGANAANSSGVQSAVQSADELANLKGARFFDTTQSPDADTRLLARTVEGAKPSHRESRLLQASAKLTRELVAARIEMGDTLIDLNADKTRDLQGRVRRALSLRELWHLRPEVFNVISMERDQSEAERRLASINRHFPLRAPKSGFASLDRDFGATSTRSGLGD
jgi:hypothetical protein